MANTISKKQMRHIYNELLAIDAKISSISMFVEMQGYDKSDDQDKKFISSCDKEASQISRELIKYMCIVMQWDD